MVKRIAILLAVLAVVVLAGSGREAQAALSCSQCSIACANGCVNNGGCAGSGASACSNGVGTCSWVCADGSGGSQDCGCTSGGGGSPIFKKKPTEPPPAKKTAKQPAKPAPATSASCAGSKRSS